MKNLFAIGLILICNNIRAQDIGGNYYVAVDGNDNNPGTYEQPWGTWQKAFDNAKPGDTVYFRGGIYKPIISAAGNNITALVDSDDVTTTTQHRTNGWRCFFAYPNEKPILDCSLIVPEGNYNTGLLMQRVHFIHFKGLTISHVMQTRDQVTAGGIGASRCSNIIFENITAHNISGPAFTFSSTVGYSGIEYDTTLFLNCDAYNNCDTFLVHGATPETAAYGGLADGWKYDAEKGAYALWEGCRAWHCSDDGFNATGSGTTIWKNCWSFLNDRSYYTNDDLGEGNGWKVGAIRDLLYDTTLIIMNCLSAFNRYSFALLDYSPYYRIYSKIYNNTSYGNYRGYVSEWGNNTSKVRHVFKNNLAWADTTGQNMRASVFSNNNITLFDNYPFFSYVIEPSSGDFVSLDPEELKVARNPDGSLPAVNFLLPSMGSSLIDGGVDVGLPFHGIAPDIGAFESNFQPGTSNQYPEVEIISPIDGEVYKSSKNLLIEAVANDPDGTIAKVEFFSGTTKIGESTNNPWSFNWTEVTSGKHNLRARATDNENANSTSASVLVFIVPDVSEFEISLIYPNPNNGKFTLFLNESYNVNSVVNIFSLDGALVYREMLPVKTLAKEFDLSKIASGFYILTLHNVESFFSKKFLLAGTK
jgi:hypothetical protein